MISVPSNYVASTPAPLVFVLHGLGATSENMLNVRMQEYAEETGYILLFPQALISPFSYAWNSGTVLNENVDDVGFMLNLIEIVDEGYNINRDRIYACGFSMGGIMSQRLGCEHSDVFAAITSVSGPFAQRIRDNCNPSRKIPLLYFHGTSDTTVPYPGSPILGTSSAMSTFWKWGDHNECGDSVIVEPLPDTANQIYHVDKLTYLECDESAEIIHHRIDGWPHSWPLFGYNVNAAAEIVRFFEKHELVQNSQLPTATINDQLPKDIQVGPNPFSGFLNLNLLNDKKLHNWTLYNSCGQSIMTGDQPERIDTRDLNNGMYILIVNVEDELYSINLIK